MKINQSSNSVIEGAAEAIEKSSENNSAISPGEIVIGMLVSLNDKGQPLVDFPQNLSNQAVTALSTLEITKANVGRQVALLFANGSLANPIIMGMIHTPLQSILENYEIENDEVKKEKEKAEKNNNAENVLVDGNRLVFEAKEEIVLKCGESSITLTKAGKILIRGKYLLNRSTGVNRILGGSVQVN